MDKADIFKQIVQFLVGFFSKGDEPVIKVEIPLDIPAPAPAAEEVIPYKISKAELLKGRDIQYPMDYISQVSENLDRLLVPLNKIREAYGKPMSVNSGWRPRAVNSSTPGAAAHSKHMEGLAADISDPDGEVMRWTLANLQLMKDLGIYMEDFRWTPNWTHYQLGAPKSGKRIFVPSTAAALAATKWDGKYDPSFDS